MAATAIPSTTLRACEGAARARAPTARARGPPRRVAVWHRRNMEFRRPLWSWLFFVHLLLVIAATVLATRGALPTGVFRAPFDKLGHLGAYGALAFLGVSFFGPARRAQVIAALLAASTLDEISQRAFPTRTFDLADLAMNFLGILALGLVAARRPSAPRDATAPRLEQERPTD